MNPELLLPLAATFFGIGEIQSLTPAKKGLGNRNYFTKTDNGEFVLRILGTQTLAGLENEISLESQLKKGGVLTIELVRGTEGNYFFDSDGQIVTCAKRIDGEHPEEVTVDLARKIGTTLAKFHRSVTSIPFETPSWMFKKVALEEVGKLPDDDMGVVITKQVRDSIDLFDADLPVGFIHSDLHLGNLLVNPQGEIVVFDFEETGNNILILDLALSASSFYENDGPSDGALLKALVEGYESIRTLTTTERQCFKKAVLYATGVAAAWLYNQSHEENARESIDSAQRVISKMDISV